MFTRRTFMQAGAVLAASPVLPARAATPLRMAYFATYSPISFQEDGVMRGIVPDLLDEALGRRLSITLTHTGYPWARAQSLVQAGEEDAICTIATPERLEYTVAVQEPVVSAPRRIFVRNNHPLLPKLLKVRNIDDLRALNPTVVSYAANGWGKANLTNFNIELGGDFDSAMKMLVVERGDIMIDNALSMQYSLGRIPGGETIRMLPVSLDEAHFQLLIRKQWPHLAMLPAIDKAVKQFKRSPAYAQLLRRYGIKL